LAMNDLIQHVHAGSATRENLLMKTTPNVPLIIAFVAVIVLFLLFGGGAITQGMMNGGTHGSGWMVERNWMWTPTLLTLGLVVALGWVLFRKLDRQR
jgi:hypothetical protein